MRYQITIRGTLDETWSDWLGEVELAKTQDENETFITLLSVNVTDQAALYGILDHLRDLNLALISVQVERRGDENSKQLRSGV